MRKCLSILAIAMFAVATFAQSPKSQRSTPKASALTGAAGAIEKADNDRTTAVIKGDMDAVDKSTADTYVFTDPNGRVTDKTELMKDLKSGAIKVSSQTISDVNLAMCGEPFKISCRKYKSRA